MHCVIESAEPLSVTARSVEFGNISLATWIEQPVISRISLILEPPLPEGEKFTQISLELAVTYVITW